MGKYTRLTIYTDGASRSNPGPAAAGIHIVDEKTKETVVDLGFPLGIATNNVAEYQAILHAGQWTCLPVREPTSLLMLHTDCSLLALKPALSSPSLLLYEDRTVDE